MVGAETRSVLIQLARHEGNGAETWRWSRQMDPAPVLDVLQNDVHVTFTGDGPIAMVRATLEDAPDAGEEESMAEADWQRVREEMEDRFDVLDRTNGPTMDWFGSGRCLSPQARNWRGGSGCEKHRKAGGFWPSGLPDADST